MNNVRQKMHIMIFPEFSSFQFSGHNPHQAAAGAGGVSASNLGNQTPSATRHNKKKGFKQNLYKSGANF